MNLFATTIIDWYKENKRDLPWRDTKDPYKIWISEIILQQTRVVQGYDYYCRFMEHFPDVETLAKASEDEVMKCWQGLGYYSRARNLHEAARTIAEKGAFPVRYEDVRALKGVGDYTAAAICSFAYDMPYAVVDGNVYRVLSRWLGVEEPIDTGAGKKLYASLADEMMDKSRPALYNQAIMDFGALQCVPSSPSCLFCPLSDSCVALQKNLVDKLPWKGGAVYTGEWKNDLKNGKGTMVWDDKSKYEGDWKDGMRHGKGTFYYTNGDKYVGDWKDDVQDGKGIYYFQNGERYEGDYANGERTGRGIYTYPNGDKYVGHFLNGQQEGQGTFTWANGAVYDGQWSKNQRSGTGKYKWANGDEYEGQWKNNMVEGEGVLHMADGSVYTGSFVRGKEEGKGVLIEKDGTRFEGFFKQGKKDGPFVEMDANGNIVRKGTFRYGRLLEEKK